MYRFAVAAFLIVGLLPTFAPAVDIKNPRTCYGPFGATRSKPTDKIKCLPGDIIFMTYEIDNLLLDKNGKASYDTILELVDDKGKVIFSKKTPNNVIPQLGGKSMPGDLHVIMGPKQAAGDYTIKLTVHDKLAKDGAAKTLFYKFQVDEPTFGFLRMSAPAIGFPGLQYVADFALVNLTLDKKKDPNTELSIRILDDKGKPVAATLKMQFPRDMPDGINLQEANFVPVRFPVFLNRPGQFTVEMTAHDKLGNHKRELRYNLSVLDVNSIASK